MKLTDPTQTKDPGRHSANDLVRLFNDLFYLQEKTILVSGGDEPLYLPANDDCSYARVIFTADYFASALHEVAHWCLAGARRLTQTDYGYWYIADRTLQQQRAFERAEVKPQALEELFSLASGYPFRPSFDNLKIPEYSSEWFNQRRAAQRQRFLVDGLPGRANQFYQALTAFYGRQHVSSRIRADG